MENKVFTVPIKAIVLFVGVVFLVKKLDIKNLLTNPLALPLKAERNTKRSKYLYYHSILFLGIASGIGAYMAREIKKYELYSRYKREVSYYIRWKMEEEIKKNIL